MMRGAISFFFLTSVLIPSLSADTAETTPLIAYLQSANEVPPTTVNATANAIVWVHVIRDSGNNITSGSVDFDVTYHFAGVTTITGLHIDDGAPGVNGQIVIPTDISGSNALVVDATGRGNVFRQVQFPSADGRLTVVSVQSLLDSPRNFHINLQTVENPGGALRGPMVAADMKVTMALLSPANENPPVTDSGASATASFLVLRGMDPTGNFTTGAVVFDADYRGFSTNTMLTGFFIHSGAAGAIGPGVINAGFGSGASAIPAGPTGAGNLHSTVFVTPEDGVAFQAEIQNLNALFITPNAYYANIHTVTHPSGEIRAQVRSTDVMNYQVNMVPGNETPPVTGLAANALTKVSVYTLRNPDASVSAGAVIFDADYRGFPAGTTFTAMHIHDGAAGVADPVTINTDISPANPVIGATGSGNIYRLVTVEPGPGINTLSSITQNPENQYVNLHTLVNPSGAVRSQLAPVNTALPVVKAVTSNPDSKTTTLAPGEIFTIYGLNLAKSQSDLSGFYLLNSLPLGLNGVTVTVGGIPAPLYFVSSFQINAQVPFNVGTGQQPVVVKNTSGASAAFNATIAAAAPAIYLYDANGSGIIVKNSDFSLVTPDTPAKAGDILVIYLTGLGQTTPALQTGNLQPGAGFNNTVPVRVTIGGQPAPVVYSIASPGFAGLYQVAFTVPAGASGTLPVIVQAGAAISNTVTAAVQ